MWIFRGKRYTRKEFYTLLTNKGQVKPLSKCRKAFRIEYENDPEPCYPIYSTATGNVFAVDRSQ